MHHLHTYVYFLQFAQFALLTQSGAVFAVYCVRFTTDNHLRAVTSGHLVSVCLLPVFVNEESRICFFYLASVCLSVCYEKITHPWGKQSPNAGRFGFIISELISIPEADCNFVAPPPPQRREMPDAAMPPCRFKAEVGV